MATSARGILVMLLSFVLWAAAPVLLGWVPTTVMTGSMMPRVSPGDVVVAMPMAAKDLLPGRILLVNSPDQPGELRFHRFLAWAEDGTHLITKGDANEAADSTPVAPSAVVGAGVLRVPFIGLPFVWWQERDLLPLAATAAGLAGLLMLLRLDPSRTTASRPRARATSPWLVRRPAPCDGRHAGPGIGAVVLVAALTIGGIAYGTSAQPAQAGFVDKTVNPSNSFATASRYDCYDKVGTSADSPFFSYRFDEWGGPSTTDSGAGNRAGSVQGTPVRTTTTCDSGVSPALRLSGTSASYVSGPAATLGLASSQEIWFKTASSSSTGQLLGFGSSATGSSSSTSLDRQLFMTSAGKVAFGSLAGATPGTLAPKTITSPLSYNNGVWHHAVATVANGNLLGLGLATAFTLYIDGVKVADGSAVLVNPGLGTGFWRVGGDTAPTAYTGAPTNGYFAGDIDGAAVYTTTLTDVQVAAHYNAGH